MSADPFYTNFEAALLKLMEFKTVYDGSEIHRAGIIQAFEFTFEQCWKAIQKKAGAEGVTFASPKKALEWAMASSWIAPTRENEWLAMINDRNLTSHTYREKTASEVANHILQTYLAEFQSILSQMKSV